MEKKNPQMVLEILKKEKNPIYAKFSSFAADQ